MAKRMQSKISVWTIAASVFILAGIHAYNQQPPMNKGDVALPNKQPKEAKGINQSSMQRSSENWTKYQNVTLTRHHNNDGDSFRVTMENGAEQEFRLYFVDTPESQLKRYQDGNTNSERIAKQASYFGNLTSEQSIALGKKAKDFMLELLSEQAFDVFSCHEEVFDSGRFYCHVRLKWKGQARWMDELLVENGLARIITQPADLPDGTSAEAHKKQLHRLQAQAKKARRGGWL